MSCIMPLRILHTADAHLGAKFLGLGEKGRLQRSQLLETFEAVVDLAIGREVNLFLVAGDLFDSNRVPKSTLTRVASRLEKLAAAGIEVCVSPGTHDPYGPDSVYEDPRLSGIPGLSVFKSEKMVPVHFPELDCTVYGNANMSPFQNKYPLAGFKVTDDSRWRVGMVHANFEIPDVTEDTYVVTAGQVGSSGLDYLALGHLHSLSDRSLGTVKAYYPGSPEMVRMRKGEFGNVLLVEMDDDVQVTAVSVGRRFLEEVTLRAEDIDSAASLRVALEAHKGPEKVLKLNIEGLRPPGYPDVAGLAGEMADFFFHIDVTDRSTPAPATVGPGAYPEDTPAGVYLRILHSRLQGCSASEADEVHEAMQVGISLLLGEGG